MTGPIAFWNGRIVPQNELTLSVADAGFVAGATITDFCRTYDGRLFRWPLHLARFRHDCAWLGVNIAATDAELTAAAEHLIAHNRPLSPTPELAVILFATPGPLGYLTGGADGPPTYGMHTLPLNPHRYATLTETGAVVAAVGRVPESDLWPVAVKHRSRIGWWQAQRSPELPPGAVPALLTAGGIADTAVAALVGVRGNTVFRAPAGTVLESVSLTVLGEVCARIGFAFHEMAIDFRELVRGTAGVEEVWLTGTGFGVAGVREVRHGEQSRALAWPGPMLTRVQAAWAELVADAGCVSRMR